MNVLTRRKGSLVAPADLTIHEAEGLKADLLQSIRKGTGPVTLVMGNVERLDTAAAQLLLAARAEAARAGRGLTLADPSVACQMTISRMGLADALFGCAKEEGDE